MSKRSKGMDMSNIVLDSSGRFQLNEEQLAVITGGKKKKKTGGIEIIRGGHCTGGPNGPRNPVTHVCTIR